MSFTVGATGSELSYQWRHQRRDIAGATAAGLALSTTTLNDGGYYEVLVSNRFGTAKSAFRVQVAAPTSAIVGWGQDSVSQSGLPTGIEDIVAGRLNLIELLRVIELYNYRGGRYAPANIT